MSNKIVNNRVQTSASDAFSFPETWSSVEISVQVAWPMLALSTNKQTNILDLTAIKQLRKIAQSLHHKRLLSFLAHDFGFVSCCLQRDIDIVTAKQPSHFSSMKFLSAQNLEWVFPDCTLISIRASLESIWPRQVITLRFLIDSPLLENRMKFLPAQTTNNLLSLKNDKEKISQWNEILNPVTNSSNFFK